MAVTRRFGDAEAGLTLIEMLIVLAIIAIVSGATVLSLAPRRGNATEAEARQLAIVIQTAADRTLATGATETLLADATGYAIAGHPRHVLPAGIALRGTPLAGLPLGLDAGAPFALGISAGADRWTVAYDGVRAQAVPAKSPA